MKKSELKKRLIEALTPDEAAKVEPKYKETYAAMIKGKGPLKLKKYDNPDKVVRGRVVNTIKNESLKIAEKLGKTAKIDDYIDDFKKSDAKQFQGKSIIFISLIPPLSSLRIRSFKPGIVIASSLKIFLKCGMSGSGAPLSKP